MMKKITLFIAMLLFAGISFAQSSDTKPYVTIHGLQKQVENGQIQLGYTTSDRIIREGSLAADVPGADVTSFTLSIMQGNTQYGPFNANGNKLTPEMLTAVKKIRGGAAIVTLSNIHVRYNGHDIVTDNTVLRYDQ